MEHRTTKLLFFHRRESILTSFDISQTGLLPYLYGMCVRQHQLPMGYVPHAQQWWLKSKVD